MDFKPYLLGLSPMVDPHDYRFYGWIDYHSGSQFSVVGTPINDRSAAWLAGASGEGADLGIQRKAHLGRFQLGN